MEIFKNQPQAVRDIIDCLQNEDCQIIQVKGSSDNFVLVVANKHYDSNVFKFNIEYHEEGEILYLATQCRKAVPSKKYHFTLDLLNRLSLTHIRVSFALCPKTFRMTCFDVVPFAGCSCDTIEYFLCGIWYGIRSLNDISKSIEKNMSLEDTMEAL